MTKEMTTSGMIIKETKVGEGNKIFTIITAEHGKIQASGAGVRSYKSKLGSGCSLFCYSDFVLKKGKSKDIYSIVSADKKMDFFDIRYDIEKVALVNYICELVNFIAVQDVECTDILRLLLNTVYYIHKNEFDIKVKSVFELRLMCEAGFAPNLTNCSRCESAQNLHYFSVEEGAVECAMCKKLPNISRDTLKAMEYITTADPKSIFSFKTDDVTAHELSVFAEQYIVHHIGYVPKSLIYLKSL